MLAKLAREPGVQIGFSDAGAHLRNMAFYNFGLRLLKRVRDAERGRTPFMSVEHAVHRLTGELADWYGLDAGHLRVGDRADVVVLDPARLDASLEEYAEAPVEQYGGLPRMVNRNDATRLAGVGRRPGGLARRARPLPAGHASGPASSSAPVSPRRPRVRRPSREDGRGGRPWTVADAVRPRLRRHRRLGHR